MYDRFNRHINYLRISVTDRCNFRCEYCMPAEGLPLKKHEDILSFDEITDIVKAGVKLGIRKLRITGGEPLVRKDLPELIQMLTSIPEIEDIGITTNGVLLPRYAKALKAAGLKRVNISLDTMNPEKFKKITRVGELNDVLRGIDAALEAELQPVKINFVRIPGENEVDEQAVREYCQKKGLKLRFIRQMDLRTGEFYAVDGGLGGICKICNRLRLTADGFIVPCLHSGLRYNIRELGIEEAYNQALENKPEKGVGTESHDFSNIGG
ncbi:radical SAM protein [Draconibacterium sp. IB214405]|uniref:GTP 3',8-cyclase MoaA n=1 Tax=Draconibacterium sp. IB214405 TaxID=3097352 RepID=UPI002A143ED4|nr:radical SAM protein [Draconibacterium sp. IB214405]MDX8340203.1 radical SAM protein [Draconibacterium sp. IB214405]